MLIAPHPDDEALACSVILQRAARAGAQLRVLYATDGDDNPWPQRAIERKWKINAADRARWGKLRRTEAMAALHVLGIRPASARFLGLPDQKLTALLTQDCRFTLGRLTKMIEEFSPTHLLIPSIADTHPDHSALGVMLRLIASEFFGEQSEISMLSYVVHGKDAEFFRRAYKLCAKPSETATKLQAIRCHKTQIKLSRKRFFGYAARAERFLHVDEWQEPAGEGAVRVVSRDAQLVRVKLRIDIKLLNRSHAALLILGRQADNGLRCARVEFPIRSSRPELVDCCTGDVIARAGFRGHAFGGEITIPGFIANHPLFLKLENRTWFFDEAGWTEVAALANAGQATSNFALTKAAPSTHDTAEDYKLSAR
jgi:LmbE family N-acetylglucosaminyl deacetylase